MTPERALTISRALAFNWEHDDESLSNLADRIRDAILQACAEEREACAKICENLMNTNADGSIRDGIRQIRVKSVYAAAIRGAE